MRFPVSFTMSGVPNPRRQIAHLEQQWPRWLLPMLAVSTPIVVVAGTQSALQWLTVALLTLPLFAALGRGQLKDAVAAYALHLVSFGLFVAARNQADEFGAPVRFAFPIAADRLIGLGSVPSVRLQQLLHTGATETPGWLDHLVFTTYTVHFFVIWLVCFVVWEQSLPRFQRFCLANGVAYAIALPMHVLLPTAPPWMAAQDGYLPPLTRVFLWVGQGVAPSTVSNGLSLSGNDVAAVPSMHMAVATLILLANWTPGGARRLASVCYLLLMLWSVVYGGEHYVVDALAGMVLGGTAWAIAAQPARPFFGRRTDHA